MGEVTTEERARLVSRDQKMSLFMCEFVYKLPPRIKPAPPPQYCDLGLQEAISVMYSKPFPVLLKGLLQLVFSVFGPKCSPGLLQSVENVFREAPDQAYMHFFYQINQLFAFGGMPHTYVSHIVKIELQPNINRFHHSVTVTAAGTNIRMHLLAPTRKERLVCDRPIIPTRPPVTRS